MKKDKLQSHPKTIDQFQFHISPLSITFNRKENSSFYLYVQKGAQVLGKIDEVIRSNHTQYEFDKRHVKKFRIANDKNLTYQWSLYRLTSDDEEQYVQSSSFNIKTHFLQYVQQFGKIQNDLYRIYYEKQKKSDLEAIWKDLRHDLKSQNEFTCVFSKFNATLTFKIKVNCEYDFMYQKWEEQKEKRKHDKKTSVTRKGSSESRNSIIKTISENSISEYRQKLFEPTSTFQEKKNVSFQPSTQPKNNEENQTAQHIRQSQIRITSPEGVDVTTETPQKFLNNRKAIDEDFYYMKKTSMLSDIIEESYEGSSNINLTKSNQGERLKSVDIIQEQQEPMFSPMIKTQTFESERHHEYFNDIKRTATLAQKFSDDFQLEETPKASSRKNSHSQKSETKKRLFENHDQKEYIFGAEISRGSSKNEVEPDNQVIEDFSEAKKLIIKNVIKVFIIVALLIFAVNLFNIFGSKDIKGRSPSKSYKNKKQSIEQNERFQKLEKNKAKRVKS